MNYEQNLFLHCGGIDGFGWGRDGMVGSGGGEG